MKSMRQYRLSTVVKRRIYKFIYLGGEVVDYREGAGYSDIVVELKLPSGTFQQKGHTRFDSRGHRGTNYKPTFTTKEGVVLQVAWEHLKNSFKENRVRIRDTVDRMNCPILKKFL